MFVVEECNKNKWPHPPHWSPGNQQHWGAHVLTYSRNKQSSTVSHNSWERGQQNLHPHHTFLGLHPQSCNMYCMGTRYTRRAARFGWSLLSSSLHDLCNQPRLCVKAKSWTYIWNILWLSSTYRGITYTRRAWSWIRGTSELSCSCACGHPSSASAIYPGRIIGWIIKKPTSSVWPKPNLVNSKHVE